MKRDYVPLPRDPRGQERAPPDMDGDQPPQRQRVSSLGELDASAERQLAVRARPRDVTADDRHRQDAVARERRGRIAVVVTPWLDSAWVSSLSTPPGGRSCETRNRESPAGGRALAPSTRPARARRR